jgi:hypothetical protein
MIMKFTVVMTYHNEVQATNDALREVLKNNDCDVLIARDALPIEVDHFKNFAVRYLTEMSCMQTIYDQIRAGKDVSKLDSSLMLKILLCNIRRMAEAAEAAETEYIFYMEPDVLVRRRIRPNTKFAMECLDVNKYPLALMEQIESISNRKLGVDGWGFCTGFATTAGFKTVVNWAESNENNLLDLLELDHRFIFADFAFPILFHLIGLEVGKTRQIVECNRNPLWQISLKPIVHQYRKSYT